MIGAGNQGEAARRLLSIHALSFRNDLALRDSVGEQIVVAYTTLGVNVVTRTAKSDDQGRDSLLV